MKTSEDSNIKTDCIHFNGYKPCKCHKETGRKCHNCDQYNPTQFRILIVKVGAAGEVLRCTCLLRRLKIAYPGCEITWVTAYPDLVPTNWVNRIMKFSWGAKIRLEVEEFDAVYSLDKDFESCAFAQSIKSKLLHGFMLNEYGKIIPCGESATRKWRTGVFDDEMKANQIHYPAEVYELCGLQWSGEKYILEGIGKYDIQKKEHQRVIGLNTGASPVWLTRIWSTKRWVELAKLLLAKGYSPIILGGPDENERNQNIAAESGAQYLGVMPYKTFFEVVNSVDCVVTGVTMALHVAIALEKKIVLLNNIFNKNEFYLYGLGVIMEPKVSCLSCYKSQYDNACEINNCLDSISPHDVFAQINKLFIE
jgi:heptosyltransferase-2